MAHNKAINFAYTYKKIAIAKNVPEDSSRYLGGSNNSVGVEIIHPTWFL